MTQEDLLDIYTDYLITHLTQKRVESFF